jgi:tRNA(Ile2) C34 agmatinyltransferase TiaS
MVYETTDDSVFIRHKENCIECGGDTSERVVSFGDSYKCDSCGVRVTEDNSGSVLVDGGVSSSTVSQNSLKKRT